MRYVAKDEAPSSFTEWKGQANENWNPTYGNLRNPQKGDLHAALLAEQGGTCCYCGRQISLDESHIEHFVPQEESEQLALEYRNLHASCIRARSPKLPLHCGHAKDRYLDEKQSISPLDPTCEQRFRYLLDGELLPSEDVDGNAIYMIELLKLNIPSLRNRRQAVLAGVFDNEFLNSASDEELRKIFDAYRTRDVHGHFPDFAHVVARFADQLIGP
jgi:uncharacterized protein (TIGR02646 family)